MSAFLRALWRSPPALRTVVDLQRFISEHAAFIAQKSAVEYCRARAGLNWDKLFREPDFVTALEVCRWESMAAVAEDIAVVVEGQLRACAVPPLERLASGLARTTAAAVADHGAPPHRPEGWEGLETRLVDRLLRAQLAAPKPSYEVAETAGGRVYQWLPIHPRLRQHDRELVTNSVRFLMTRMAEDLGHRLDREAVAGALAGD